MGCSFINQPFLRIRRGTPVTSAPRCPAAPPRRPSRRAGGCAGRAGNCSWHRRDRRRLGGQNRGVPGEKSGLDGKKPRFMEKKTTLVMVIEITNEDFPPLSRNFYVFLWTLIMRIG